MSSGAACRVAKLPQVTARQAAVWAKQLAARGAAHHNKGMKVLAWPLGALWWRLLACLLVAVAALALAPEVLAQAAGAINTNFPYLGPDPQKAFMAFNAFTGQFKLFSSSTGGPGGFQALYYLALLATMIGALLIIFNAKFRALSTLGPWLILVVIMLFAPFGSRLLFAPIPVPTATGGNSVAPSAVAASAANANQAALCGGSAGTCGFTPQLVAMHITSVLHVLLADLFSSQGWIGIVDNLRADTRVQTDPRMNVGADWLRQYNEFVNPPNQCSPNILTGGTPPAGAADALVRPMNLETVWNSFSALYANEQVNTAPKMIVLPNAAKVNQFWGGQTGEIDKYLRGIKALHRMVGGADQNVTLTASVGTIGLDAALQKIHESPIFTVVSPEALSLPVPSGTRTPWPITIQPGFFMMPDTAPPASHGGITRQNIRGCYNVAYNQSELNFMGLQVGSTARACASAMGPARSYVSPVRHRRDYQRILPFLTNPQNAATILNAEWARFLRELMSDDIKNMPVLVGSFPSTFTPAQTAPNTYDYAFDANGIATGYAPITPVQLATFSLSSDPMPIENGYNCQREGLALVRAALDIVAARSGNVDFLSRLRAWINGTTNVPRVITREGPDALSAMSAEQTNTFTDGFITNFTTYLNSQLEHERNELRVAELNQDQARRVVRVAFLDAVYRATNRALGVNEQRSQAERTAVDLTRPRVTGTGTATNSLLGSAPDGAATGFAWLAGFLGRVVIWIGSWFYGIVALVYTDFLNTFIDMALMAIIMLTPFLFLAGLVIPSNAPGVIAIAIIGVFVLKFTAISFVMLNALGGMMYAMIDSGMINDAWTAKATLVIAMSGLYTGIIAFSLYLMFKVGDANMFVSKLASLDDAAKEAAKVGVTAATAVVGFAATAAFGAAGGTAGAIYNKVRASGLAKAVPGLDGGAAAGAQAAEMMNARAQQTRAREELRNDAAAGGPDAAKVAELDGLMTPGAATVRDSAGEEWEKLEGIGWRKSDDIAQGMSSGRIGRRMNAAGRSEFYFRDANGRMDVRDEEFAGIMSEQFPDGVTATNVDKSFRHNGQNYIMRQDAMGNPYVQVAMADSSNFLVNAPKDMGPEAQAALLAQMNDPGDGQGSLVQELDGKWYQLKQIDPAKGTFEIVEIAGMASEAKETAMRIRGEERKVDPESRRKDLVQMQERATFAAQQFPSSTPAAPVDEAYEAEKEMVREERAKSDRRARAEKEVDNQMALERLNNIPEVDRTKAQTREIKERQEFGKFTSKLDPIAIRVGDHAAAQQFDQEWNALQERIKSQQSEVGVARSAFSGMLGGMAASFGGVGSVPILGDVLKETFNEFTQAPERARAWQVNGGFMKNLGLKGDAARVASFKKELGATTGGYEYRDMVQAGTFQAQHDLQRTAVAQAVARQRSEWEGMQYAFRDINQGKPLSAIQLQGLGRDDAFSKAQSLRVEAGQMQGGVLMVKAMDIRGQMVDREVRITPGLLNDFAQTSAWKGDSSKRDASMVQQYGVIEKRYMRGGDWAKAERNLNQTERVRDFIKTDLDTDYIVGGHLKMVEGKMAFMGMKAKYDTYRSLRLNEEAQIETYLRAPENFQAVAQILRSNGMQLPVNLTPASLNANPDMAIKFRKEAAKVMDKAGIFLPLEGLMQEAAANARTSVMNKVLLARGDDDYVKSRETLTRAMSVEMERNNPDITRYAFQDMNVRDDLNRVTKVQRVSSAFGEKYGEGAIRFLKTTQKMTDRDAKEQSNLFLAAALPELDKAFENQPDAVEYKSNPIKIPNVGFKTNQSVKAEPILKMLDTVRSKYPQYAGIVDNMRREVTSAAPTPNAMVELFTFFSKSKYE